MCFIFNIFVFYTLFNQINCRVIDDSINIFVRINRSILFPLICLAEMGLQVLIIFIGKSPFHIVNDGLTGKQWGICIGFSAITFVISFIVKFIPLHVCIDNYLDKKIREEEIEEEKLEENEELSQSNLNIDKFGISSRRNNRRLNSRISKNKSKSDSKPASSNQNINIYNMKKS